MNATPGASASAAERLAMLHWPGFRASGRLPQGVAGNVTVPVEVNHGRWLTRCPWCNSANLASRADRRFLCCECGNVGVGGQWVRVVWPDPPTVQQIERVLLARPDPHTRNWLPGETVADLVAENEANGVVV